MKYFLYCFQHYADFNGRARRSEFWYFQLFKSLFVFLTIFIGLILLLMGGAFQEHSTSGFPFVLSILGALLMLVASVASFGLLIPDLAVTARRLHDTGRSGWFQLLRYVPIVGGILLLIWYCTDSEPGENQYGPNPLKV